MRRLLISCNLITSLLFCAACHVPPMSIGPGATSAALIPHIESVDFPSSIHAGVPIDFVLHLSAQQHPEILQEPEHPMFAIQRSPSFAADQTSGVYEPGIFSGLIINPHGAFGPATFLGPSSETVTLQVTFSQSGQQILYLGNAASSELGGLEVTEFVTNHGYPNEDNSVRYLRIPVSVQP